MQVGIPREAHPEEARVAIPPEGVGRLRALGFEVLVEAGAGLRAGFPDGAYAQAEARVVEAEAAWSADIVVRVRPPAIEEVGRLRPGAVLVAPLAPAANRALLTALAERGVTAIALDAIPRITRAQKMDVLSSMAVLAGYRAVIEAAWLLPTFLGGQVTAAGRVRPARVLVIGAGVAGLSAIATARALGAEVRAFDVRPEVREEVESLGARFLEVDLHPTDVRTEDGYARDITPAFLEAEARLFQQQAREVDVIVTTALVAGGKAPKLLEERAVRAMAPGSVVVDLAAPQGGNCACTVPGETIDVHGVKVHGPTDLLSRMAPQASRFFGVNLGHLLEELGGAQHFHIDLDDVVFARCTVVSSGQVRWPPPPLPPSERPGQAATRAPPPLAPRETPPWVADAMLAVAGLLLVATGAWAPEGLVRHLTVFALACIVGWHVIWRVKPALHTPLMSVTNAISAIILVGGLLQAGSGRRDGAALLGAAAVFFAAINVSGGFLVTRRMLGMFRRGGAS